MCVVSFLRLTGLVWKVDPSQEELWGQQVGGHAVYFLEPGELPLGDEIVNGRKGDDFVEFCIVDSILFHFKHIYPQEVSETVVVESGKFSAEVGSNSPRFAAPQDGVEGDSHARVPLHGKGDIRLTKDATELPHLPVGLF